MFSRARIATIVLLAAGALVAVPGLSSAQTTANFAVSANVQQRCTITASGINFSEYNPLATTDLDQTGALAVRCTKGTTITVGLDDGAHPSGTIRRMAHATDATGLLSYELYRDSARADADRWGSALANRKSYTAETFGPTTLTVYGRITAGQDVPVGNYSDTVVATVNF